MCASTHTCPCTRPTVTPFIGYLAKVVPQCGLFATKCVQTTYKQLTDALTCGAMGLAYLTLLNHTHGAL